MGTPVRPTFVSGTQPRVYSRKFLPSTADLNQVLVSDLMARPMHTQSPNNETPRLCGIDVPAHAIMSINFSPLGNRSNTIMPSRSKGPSGIEVANSSGGGAQSQTRDRRSTSGGLRCEAKPTSPQFSSFQVSPLPHPLDPCPSSAPRCHQALPRRHRPRFRSPSS